MCTVYELILSLVCVVRGVGRGDFSIRDRRRWDHRSTCDVSIEAIAVKQGLDLTAPHEEVGGRELRNIGHVNVKDGVFVVGDVDSFS